VQARWPLLDYGGIPNATLSGSIEQGGYFLENREKSGNLVHHGEVRSRGILEISVKVRGFFKKEEENFWMKLKILRRAAFHATLPTFEKRIRNNTSLEEVRNTSYKSRR